MNNKPGAAIDFQIAELGAAIVERTDRLASDISQNNAKIEELRTDLVRVKIAAVFVVIVALVSMVIVWRLAW